MKQLLITIAAAVLVIGCATTQQPEPPAIAESINKTFQPEQLQDNLLGYRHIYLEALDGNIEGVKALLAGGVSVDSMGAFVGTPLSVAAEEGHKDMVELLIANRANVNALTRNPLGHGGQTPLDLAILKIYDSRDYKGTIELLRKHGGKTAEELKAEGK